MTHAARGGMPACTCRGIDVTSTRPGWSSLSGRAVTPRKDRKGVECGLSPASVQEMSPESRLERPRFVYYCCFDTRPIRFRSRISIVQHGSRLNVQHSIIFEIRIARMAPSVSVSVRASRPTPLQASSLESSPSRFFLVSSNPVRFYFIFVRLSLIRRVCISLHPVLRCKK